MFIGRATGEHLIAKLTESLVKAGVSLTRIPMLGSDGPNVNKKVARLLDNAVKLLREKGLIDVGTCNIHLMHNAFLHDIESFGEEASDLIINIYEHFNGWPGRWEDFSLIQAKLGLPDHRFLKHVKSRWLTLESSAERVIEQMPVLRDYFIDYLPKHLPTLFGKKGTQTIVQSLKKKTTTMEAELLFIISSAKVFTKFTSTFQKDEPLIHVMYEEIKTVFQTIALRICKKSAYDKYGLSTDVFDSANLMLAPEIKFSDEIKEELSKSNIKGTDRLVFLTSVQSHYKSAAVAILQKSVLTSLKIRAFRCLDPKERQTSRSCGDITSVARCLTFSVPIDILLDKWRLMQLEVNVCRKEERIDSYWAQFFEKKTAAGDLKYPVLSKVVKAALSLSHGNAYVERGFSTSAQVLAVDSCSMSEQTLNNINMAKSGLRLYGNQPTYVPITKELLAKAKLAHSEYISDLEEKRKRRQEELRKQQDDKQKRKMEEEAVKKMEEEDRRIKEDENFFA